MKKMIVIINYWLMIIAWCLFLNGNIFLSEVVIIIGSLLLIRNNKINHSRLAIYSLLNMFVLTVILNSSRIPYFFPKMPIHLLLIGINCAITNECLNRLNSHFILPIIFIILLSLIFISILIIIIPAEFYSLIGKANLLLLESFIFLPYLISSVLNVVSKAHKKNKNTYITKKELQM